MQQLQGNNLANVLLETQIQRLNTTHIRDDEDESEAAPVETSTLETNTIPSPVRNGNAHDNTINIRLGLDPSMVSQMSALRINNPPPCGRSLKRPSPFENERETNVPNTGISDSQTATAVVTANSWLFEGTYFGDVGRGFQSYEDLRASMLRTAHPVARKRGRVASSRARRVVKPVNQRLRKMERSEEDKAY